MAIKNLTVRIDSDILNKLHYISNSENRSANGQILALIQTCIAEFEKKHGQIELDKK